MRTTDNKLTRWVDVVLDLIVEELEHLLALDLCFNAWYEDVEHISLDCGKHALVVIVKLIVLG